MIYTIGITAVSCLMPLAGLVIGLYFRNLGKKREKRPADPRYMSGEKLKRMGRWSMTAGGVWLAVTVVATILASGLSHKGRVLAAVALVSLQYVTALVLVIFIAKVILKKEDKN